MSLLIHWPLRLIADRLSAELQQYRLDADDPDCRADDRQSLDAREPFSLDDNIDKWETLAAGPGDPPQEEEYPACDRQHAELEDEIDVAAARSFLIDGEPYQWLLTRMRNLTLLTPTGGKVMRNIHESVMSRLETAEIAWRRGLRVEFVIECNLIGFLEEQYATGRGQKLASIICLTGETANVQALTCERYMNLTWPITGAQTLQAVQKAVSDRLIGAYQGTCPAGTDA